MEGGGEEGGREEGGRKGGRERGKKIGEQGVQLSEHDYVIVSVCIQI